MFKNILVIIFSFLICSMAWACPGCAGSMKNPADTKLVYILAGFILFTYIPFYFLYKNIIKHRNLNKFIHEAVSGPNNAIAKE